MQKRRRFKQTSSLEERLSADLNELNERIKTLQPGAERERLVRRMRQDDTALHICELLKTPS
jgi:hypothetical protein